MHRAYFATPLEYHAYREAVVCFAIRDCTSHGTQLFASIRLMIVRVSTFHIGRSGKFEEATIGLLAFANACAHPVLAQRAKELEALGTLTVFAKVERVSMVRTVGRFLRVNPFVHLQRVTAGVAISRLNGSGVEEGGRDGRVRSDTSLQLFRFKWAQPMGRTLVREFGKKHLFLRNFGVCLMAEFTCFFACFIGWKVIHILV